MISNTGSAKLDEAARLIEEDAADQLLSDRKELIDGMEAELRLQLSALESVARSRTAPLLDRADAMKDVDVFSDRYQSCLAALDLAHAKVEEFTTNLNANVRARLKAQREQQVWGVVENANERSQETRAECVEKQDTHKACCCRAEGVSCRGAVALSCDYWMRAMLFQWWRMCKRLKLMLVSSLVTSRQSSVVAQSSMQLIHPCSLWNPCARIRLNQITAPLHRVISGVHD
jgi:hypothetical protein